MTEHPRQYPRSALQRTRGLTTENMEGPQITMPPGRKGFIKEHSGGQFVHFRIQIFISPRVWDGDRDRGTKPTWLFPPLIHPDSNRDWMPLLVRTKQQVRMWESVMLGRKRLGMWECETDAAKREV